MSGWLIGSLHAGSDCNASWVLGTFTVEQQIGSPYSQRRAAQQTWREDYAAGSPSDESSVYNPENELRRPLLSNSKLKGEKEWKPDRRGKME